MTHKELLERVAEAMERGFAGDAKRLLEAELAGATPEAATPLVEVGKTISAKTEGQIKAACEALMTAHGALMGMLDGGKASGGMETEAPAYEAAAIEEPGEPLIEADNAVELVEFAAFT
jgi:hypothetical protein